MVIHLHGGGSYPNVHMVKLIIERSANTQLSIDLRVTDMMDEKMFRDPTSAANLCMDILLGSLARWHDLRVYLRGSALPLPMIWLLRTSLERLQLDAQLIFPIVDHAHTRLWARSPKLDKLFLSYSDYTSWRPPIPHTEQVPKMLPYSQLTSLYIHTSIAHGAPSAVVSAHDVVSIFHDSPNLVSCIFTNIAVLSDSSVVTMKRSVNMPRLEYLHLGGFPDKERVELPLTDILAYIMAPNLSVIAFTNIQSWGQDEFESFILRSVCSLKEIHILNPNNFGPTTLLPILRSLPSVQGIHIGRIQNLLDEPLFVTEMMAWNTGRGEFELCPELSWLSLQDPICFDIHEPKCDINTLGITNLARILKRRLDVPDDGKRRFDRIYIPADKLLTDVYNDIRALCSDPYGLDVQVDDGEMYEIYNLWERYGDK